MKSYLSFLISAENVAYTRKATIVGIPASTFGAAQTVDGDKNTYFQLPSNQNNALRVELDNPGRLVSRLVIVSHASGIGQFGRFSILACFCYVVVLHCAIIIFDCN